MLYLGGRSFLRENPIFHRGRKNCSGWGEEKRLGRVRPGTAEGGCPILGGGGKAEGWERKGGGSVRLETVLSRVR